MNTERENNNKQKLIVHNVPESDEEAPVERKAKDIENTLLRN